MAHIHSKKFEKGKSKEIEYEKKYCEKFIFAVPVALSD